MHERFGEVSGVFPPGRRFDSESPGSTGFIPYGKRNYRTPPTPERVVDPNHRRQSFN
jgi:hypothetical protein